MTYSMTCEAFEGLLPRYLEDEASSAEQQALEVHAAGCDACGALLGGIRDITAEAGALPALVPSRDLWEGIAARIEAPAIALESRRPAAARTESRPAATWDRRWLAAAAAALVIATAGSTHLITRQMMTTASARVAVVDVAPEPSSLANGQAGGPEGSSPFVGPPDVASGPGSPNAPGSGGSRDSRGSSAVPRASDPGATVPRQSRPAVGTGAGTLVSASSAVEAVYDAEIAQLQDVLDRRRGELDPATTVVLENNLRIIDRAIRDSRSALARDPASGFLTDQLTMALDKKLQLMRTAARLPSRT